ncbi:LOW QUALITY PROTEIN: transmembrane protein 106A [Etheostoma cragini]|uniref:LOW QUALITY PROTEIN: transmembrane protein 106A n=1 Tax=Etheostoma cragini TaxID=417921 RepID=UPI00155E11A3|nr:LOW QUALITY PROTEIN: transmembrane protein 106A [Etheostoma cragini]
MVIAAKNSKSTEGPDLKEGMEEVKTLKQFPPYGAISGHSSADTCPTCRGTGRIPRGHEDQLVAVIPCNDARLKPRRTKLYVCISMALCLFLCCLILFFLFPRSVILTPVSVLSVMVYFTPDTTEMEVTVSSRNTKALIYLPCNNFSSLIFLQDTIEIDLHITDKGLNTYCKSSSIKIHTLFLELQMTMNISYLSHMEQLSLNTFEYIDCGTNSTTPHPVR